MIAPTLGRAAALALALGLGTVRAEPPDDIDAYADALLTRFGTPGMALTIVEQGRVTLARGYGRADATTGRTADAHTLFPIGSNTKAMTAAALAILNDEGALRWDDRVIDHLPGFRMSDPYVTREMTIRDLLVHRSGLERGQGDLLFWPETDYTPDEIVQRVGRLPLKQSFRAGYAYDNVLYIVAGQVVARHDPEGWHGFVRKRILAPAGMAHSVTDYTAAPEAERAALHVAADGDWALPRTMRPVARPLAIANAAAAGSVWSDATDMGRWLAALVLDGALPEGPRLFSAAAAEEMATPQTLMPLPPRPEGDLALTMPTWWAYGLGVIVRDYRGHRIVLHTGAVTGGVSIVTRIPEKGVAFSVLTNAEETGVTRAMTFRLLDHYLGLETRDWPEALAEARRAELAAAHAAVEASAAARPEGKPPSLPLAAYAGVYDDPWYGSVSVAEGPNGLRIAFDRSPGMTGDLQPWSYDTFLARWDDRAIPDALVTFRLDADAAVDGATLKALSPLADFSFDYQDLALTRRR